jgi:hypothetical protein
MVLAIVNQENRVFGLPHTIDGDHDVALRLQDNDVIDGFPIPVVDLVLLPIAGEARRKAQFVYLQPEPEERFRDEPVRPSG